MSYYHTCPRCGANLDPSEKCDCLFERIQKEEKERRMIVLHHLKMALARACPEFYGLELVNDETVDITFKNGDVVHANIALDSPMAMIRDVVKHIY